MTKTEIAETTSTPYMGLEVGSTKSRQAWNGAVRKLLGTRVGYYFEVAVATRGALDFDLSRRTVANNSAILRRRSDLFDEDGKLLKAAKQPTLFSVFMDTSKRPEHRKEMMFSIQLSVSMLTYRGEESSADDHYVPGEYLFRDTLAINAIPPDMPDASWRVGYVFADSGWSNAKDAIADSRKDEQGKPYVAIPLENAKGFKATLRLYGTPWQ